VFDRPNTPLGSAAAAVALYERTVPRDADAGAELPLADLPEPTIVLADPPSIVYVRALEGGRSLEVKYRLKATMPVEVSADTAKAYEYYDPNRKATAGNCPPLSLMRSINR
jgi:hypothetical protein